MKKIGLLMFLCLFVSCVQYDDIPSEDMVDIITESLLTSSIAASDYRMAQAGSSNDTVDFYAPILERYGYTIDDFRYTVREMSARKSNPLNEIFDRVSEDIDSLASVAEYRYLAAMRYDTMVLNFYADTVYTKDTTIRGSLKKYKFNFKKPQKGNYTVKFDYGSVADYRSGTKALTYRLARKGEAKMASVNKLWINRSVDTAKFVGVVEVENIDYDTLFIGFQEPIIDKGLVKQFKDTSFIASVEVVYTPFVERARQMYYHRYFEGMKFYEIIKNEKDSLPVYFGR